MQRVGHEEELVKRTEGDSMRSGNAVEAIANFDLNPRLLLGMLET